MILGRQGIIDYERPAQYNLSISFLPALADKRLQKEPGITPVKRHRSCSTGGVAKQLPKFTRQLALLREYKSSPSDYRKLFLFDCRFDTIGGVLLCSYLYLISKVMYAYMAGSMEMNGFEID